MRFFRRWAKRIIKALGRRSPGLRRLTKRVRECRDRAAYRAICESNPIERTTVVFESYVGSSYSCSPKAIYQAMVRDPRFDDHTLIWAFKQPEVYASHPDLQRATVVPWGSPEYFAAYARAKYWVCNVAVQPRVAPRDDQVYLETWHGTPLKRFGCDITPMGMTSRRAIEARLRRWRRSASKFTYLLSQSPWATGKLVSAIGLDPGSTSRVVMEEGYPRNDFLSTFSTADVERISAALDLPADKKVVLYAPTWRDDQRTPGLGYTLELGLDFDRLRHEIGDDHVVLFRAHFMISEAFDFDRYDGFVRDVSRVDDVNELYVVSDVLVTDYSSVFFDYANLERPVVFYMYDLDRYSDARGGFYLDLEELPGPVVRTEEGLAAAIRAAAEEDADRAVRYGAFRQKFTPHDDGHASERVLDRVFGSKELD